MKSFRYLTALGLSLGLFSAPAADAVLISTKSLGMAGVGYGYAFDGMAAAHNPGAAAALDSRFDTGLIFSHLKGNTTFVDNALGPLVNGKYNGYHRTKNFYSPYFGLNYNVDCNLTVGLVVYNRDLAKTTYKDPFVLLGTSPAGLEYLHETVSPYIAYRYGCHNFGVSVNWEIQRAKVNGFENFAAPSNLLASVFPNDVTNKGYNWSNGVGFTFGYYVHLTDTLNFGVSYQPKTKMSRFKKYRGFLADAGKFDVPEKVGVGFSWRFLQCATFAFDYEYVHWTQVKAVKNKLLNEEGELNQLGSENGPGFGWTDKHYFRFGLDYAWNDCLTLRLGYRYAPTQIKPSQTVLNGFTLEPLVENILTAGFSWGITCCDEVDFFAAYGFDKKMNGRDSVPPGAPPAGFYGGNANLDQDIIAVGIGWGHRF
ncbi:MAG: outer membrane protein transport protein [Chlamydiia bacterium]|nr:outer membrane protein transport protein [Chlamydiia bacterium]